MKRIILPILFVLTIINTNAYTPIIYLNGQPYNAGLAYGITALQELMDNKSNEFSPSLQAISSTMIAKNDDLEYGALVSALTYNQKLDGLAEGLFFQTIVPIAIVSNKIDTRFVTPNSINDLTMLIQNAGVADITLLLGYKLFDQPTYQTAFNIDVIFPTQKTKNASEQFIPTMGNNGHIELGASLDGNMRMVGDDKQNLTFAAEAHYHYLLHAEKQHLLGLNRTTRTIINQALIGHATQILPKDNATIADVTIASNSNLDIIAGITYNYHKFFMNIGCSYHFKSETTITSGSNIFAQKFDKFQLNGKTVSLKNIDPAKHAATLPESHLLKISGTIGFACKEWIMPIFEIPYAYNFSLGGTVTAMHANEAAGWDFSMKSGISF